jgi:hypothetical protein
VALTRVVVVAVVVVVGACSATPTADTSPAASVPPSSSTVIETTTTAPVSSTTATVLPSGTMTTLAQGIPDFGSRAWIGVEFTVAPGMNPEYGSTDSREPGSGFAINTFGEMPTQIVVGDEPTGIWVWEPTVEAQRLVIVGEGQNPYLPVQAGVGTSITIPEPSDPFASHDLMVWSITGTTRNHWKVADVMRLRLTAGFLATHTVWRDCFDDTDPSGVGNDYVLGWINPDEWQHNWDDQGNYLGSDDVRPHLAIDTGLGGPILVLDPSLVSCRMLY